MKRSCLIAAALLMAGCATNQKAQTLSPALIPLADPSLGMHQSRIVIMLGQPLQVHRVEGPFGQAELWLYSSATLYFKGGRLVAWIDPQVGTLDLN